MFPILHRLVVAVGGLVVVVAMLTGGTVPAAAADHTSAAPIIRVVPWRAALYQMRHGSWCWRLAPGRFACTRASMDPYVQVLATDLGGMRWLILHDFECTGTIRRWWICAPI
jgi:hypothetical protein